MTRLAATLEASAIAATVRESTFHYPAANVVHVLAVLLFFAAVAAMDARILGLLPGPPAAEIVARLRPVAVALLLVIAASGAVLFLPEATRMIVNPAFIAKFAVIGVAMLNVAAIEWTARRAGWTAPLVRAAAAVSVLAWLVVAALGRLIAYV